MSTQRMTVSRLAHHHPRRPVDWRFLRIQELITANEPPRRCRHDDDRWVRRFKEFEVRWRACQSDASGASRSDYDAVAIKYPDCYFARMFRESDGPPSLTDFDWMVPVTMQARMLARQSFAEIAQLACTSEVAVEAYEALFYNVVDRLDHRDFIVNQIIIPALYRQCRMMASHPKELAVAPFLDGTLKLFAYFCGPVAVDALTSGFATFQTLRSAEELDQFFDEHWKRSIRRRSAQASSTFEINRFNVTELFAIHARVMELEMAPGAGRKAKGEFERRVKAALDAVPWSPATLAGDDYRPGRLGDYSDSGAELRDSEFLPVCAGERTDATDEEILRLGFPDAPSPTGTKPR